MDDLTDAIHELDARLGRYPPGRYPIQHATARFHLGVALANAGRTREARESLQEAARLFESHNLAIEHAKTLNALGVVLRDDRDLNGAAGAFECAAEVFESADLPLEQGAALFNLGLAYRDAGDNDAAVMSLTCSKDLLDPRRVPGQAAAAARELGATRLTMGDINGAVVALEEAVAFAGTSSDQVALGSASNVVGLAYLAVDRIDDAVVAFKSAAGAHPRTVRPDGFAMAKANLALAYERAGEPVRARLAARQALSTDAPPPVRAQATAVLERLGDPYGDLARGLENEHVELWPALFREELVFWLEADGNRREREVSAWIDDQSARPDGIERAEAWLGALLELPPAEMEEVIESTIRVVSKKEEAIAQPFRSQTSRAMARFHVPQWMRLKDTFNRVAEKLGHERSWG